jgi:hypothetical protein
MKKYLLIFVIAILLTNIPRTYALIVFDPSNFQQNVVSYVKQGFQYITELATKYSSSVTAVQQTLSTVKQTITDPLKDAMTVIAITDIAKKNANLVMGGLGNQALFKTDPEEYAKTKFTESTKASLGDVAALSGKGGIYSNSILNKVVTDVRGAADLSQYTKSSIPSSTQKAKCTDAALSEQAKSDVIKTDGTYSQSELTARKQAIYNAICTCNPDTDTKCAQTLTSVNKQAPTLDSLLAIASGDNGFEKATRASLAINRAAEAKKMAAKTDLTQGGGIASQTKCKERAKVDANNKPYTATDLAPCISEEISKGSAQIKAAYDDTIGAPLKTLQASLNSSGVASIFRDFGDIIGTVGAFTAAFSSVVNDGDSSSGSSSGSRTTTTTNGATTVTRVSEAIENITDPKERERLINPALKQIRPSLAAIDEITGIDNNYLSEIAATKGNLFSLQSCYVDLIKDHPEVASDERATNAKTYYTQRLSALDIAKTKVETELASLPEAKNKVNTAISTLSTTRSSETVDDVVTDYIDQADVSGIPDGTTVVTRKGNLDELTSTNQTDLGPTGNITTMKSDCAEIRANLEKADLNA